MELHRYANPRDGLQRLNLLGCASLYISERFVLEDDLN